MAARSYIDLTAAIAFAQNYTFRVGANNLLDQDPPLVGQANCAPTILQSGLLPRSCPPSSAYTSWNGMQRRAASV